MNVVSPRLSFPFNHYEGIAAQWSEKNTDIQIDKLYSRHDVFQKDFYQLGWKSIIHHFQSCDNTHQECKNAKLSWAMTGQNI